MKYGRSLPGFMEGTYEEATYDGEWKAGKRDGLGTLTWADGSYFTGIWQNDKRYQGEMRFMKGGIYQG